MEREYIKGTWQLDRSFSRAVVTHGGKTIWVAGHGATTDSMGRPIPHDFEAQARQSFINLAASIEAAGGKLQDLVTMTVFIIDARHGDRFVQIRKEFFPDENYPASALITVAGFARPEMMVEIQGIAVVDDG